MGLADRETLELAWARMGRQDVGAPPPARQAGWLTTSSSTTYHILSSALICAQSRKWAPQIVSRIYSFPRCLHRLLVVVLVGVCVCVAASGFVLINEQPASQPGAGWARGRRRPVGRATRGARVISGQNFNERILCLHNKELTGY